MPDILWWVAVLFAVLGITMFIAAGTALRRRRPIRMSARLLLALVFLAGAAASGAVALGVQGYRALPH